ncbi:type IV pilus secretin PilQ family protein [Pseudoxanthomonas daejeonensis]|uniref:type IV pilus secretin PilQ n=1 Tax=Pseudoxanthomonas daejeonensis TaxID=266062 RepID=UPI001F5409CE|nr:type IV pilus secretin PilQ family protein [Pseudoxanthomonas daejeonensis]UNK58095.1 type IV pilus secretin PilQ family protein [Pseudoxanthomonas daejeonensis]
MTFSNAQSLRTPRRPAIIRACGLGLALALSAPCLTATAATPQAGAAAAAKSKVSQIDFKRGDGGAGRLILRFDGDGAAPDLRNQDGSVVVDVANASLPAELQRPLNVTDFATPVQRIDAKSYAGGTQLVLSTRGDYESLAYQTGNEYVVEISPRASAAAVGAVSGPAVAGVNARIAKQGYSGRPVTFNFQDVPVRTVLQLIAEESNLNIVASDTVTGNVTLRLVNVPWDQAMDIVLRAKGLDKRRDGSVIWVAPQPELAAFEKAKEDARIDLENRVDLVTDYIQINYHNAAAIFKALTEAKGIGNQGQGGGGGGNDQENGFLSPRGRIVADERTNTLMISDIPKKVAQMRELISVIDRPVDQVLIESRIVIATDSFARDLGARFGVQGREIGNNTRVISGSLENNVDIIQDGTYNIPGGLNFNLPATTASGMNVGALAYTLLGANFAIDIELSALQQEGRGEVLSNPRVVTSNQREAIIRQGREVGYVTLTGGGSQAFPTPTVEFKDVVLELKVTPTITSDDRVFMVVHVTKDEVLRYIDTSIGQVPEIATREINTAVLVDDGQTVVIGGVYEFTDANSVAKVPFLGNVPFLGAFFKKTSRTKDKAELLIFLTPKVMRVEKRA